MSTRFYLLIFGIKCNMIVVKISLSCVGNKKDAWHEFLNNLFKSEVLCYLGYFCFFPLCNFSPFISDIFMYNKVTDVYVVHRESLDISISYVCLSVRLYVLVLSWKITFRTTKSNVNKWWTRFREKSCCQRSNSLYILTYLYTKDLL